MKRVLTFVVGVAWAAACASGGPGTRPDSFGVWGVETRYVAPDVAPGADFYSYVNHGWLQTAEFPRGFATNNAFLELALRAEAHLEALIHEAAAADVDPSSPGGQIAALYASHMDAERLETLGLDPIQPGLDAVQRARSHEDIARLMGRPFQFSMVGVGIRLDPLDPQHYVLSVGQSGLGLPGRDYYLRDDPPFPGHRVAYRDYLASTFSRAGLDRVAERAQAVLDFERAMAERHWTPAERRDRLRNYNPMSPEELEAYAPGFPWSTFFRELGVEGQEKIVVRTDTAVQALAARFAETSLETLRDYLFFHYIDDHAEMLSAQWDLAHFEFFGQRLGGVKQQRERDRRAIQFVNRSLGEPLGRLYVERHFPPASKAAVAELVGFLKAAFRRRLERLEWMDEATRAEAFAKLDAFATKIGYPDVWRDYSTVRVDATDLVGNAHRLAVWKWADSKSRLGGPRREWEWGLSPQTVNAYYASSQNEIVFPAAILQPPFFDPDADAAVNFGGIGAVIGHELGHGFDDQGSRSDGEGLLRNWWTEASQTEFQRRAQRLVAQYAAYEPIEGIPINGELTLGENIGDLGGLSIAYDAYRLYLEERQRGTAPVLDGFTGDQRFFLGWGQIWHNITTDEYLQQRLLTDPHSPGRYRVNGVVRNIDAWYEAFGVDDAAPLYLAPEERVRIW